MSGKNIKVEHSGNTLFKKYIWQKKKKERTGIESLWTKRSWVTYINEIHWGGLVPLKEWMRTEPQDEHMKEEWMWENERKEKK